MTFWMSGKTFLLDCNQEPRERLSWVWVKILIKKRVVALNVAKDVTFVKNFYFKLRISSFETLLN